MQNTLVVLVHGFFKGPRDMAFLAKGLEQRGYSVLRVKLPTTFGSLEDCVDALHRQAGEQIRQAASVSFVAHSMGGLIVRAYWQRYSMQHLQHSVFIATPHEGSRLAEIACKVPGYRQVFKAVNALLSNRPYAAKPHSLFKLGVIAGSRNQGLGRFWLSAQSDGRVEIASVRAADIDELITLPFGHKAIHQQPACLKAVLGFLEQGQFGC